MSQVHSTIETKHIPYKHLSLSERGRIQSLLEEKVPKREIAKRIGIARSTLYEELNRGTVEQVTSQLVSYTRYFADTGQSVYESNRKACQKPFKFVKAQAFVTYATQKILEEKWSPDAVCGRARHKNLFAVTLCSKTLYRYIDLQIIPVKNIDLPLRVRRKYKTAKVRLHRKQFGNSIELRPSSVSQREEYGHWEIDTMVGKRTAGSVLLTLDERMTRKRFMLKLPNHKADSVKKAYTYLKGQFGNQITRVVKSITSDNGSEFYSLSSQFPLTPIYYAHPQCAWERGTNEKQNSLVRRFIPKGTDMDTVSTEALQLIADWINNLPRKIFGYRTANEMFEEQQALLSTS